jgi:hypothetical protein
MSNESNIKHVLVIGQPTQMVEDLFPHLDPNEPKAPDEVFKRFGGFTYVDAPSELVDPNNWTMMGGQGDVDVLTDTLLCFVKKGGVIYLGSALERTSDDHKALVQLDEVCPNAILDEAIELLKLQLGKAIADPLDFETAVIEAMDVHNVAGEKVIFAGAEEDNVAAFHAPLRASKTHTLKWCPDGTIELDGAILRRTALMGIGHLKTEVLGGRVLEPGEVVGFIANRMALNGVDDLVGYGRAFGPGKEDHTNATLTDEGRQFRAHGIVGVVSVHGNFVSKAKPAMVELVAQALHQLDPKQPLFLHQQVKEIYEGEEAMKAFRAQMEKDGRVTLFGKSTKHTRVDAGAYCLYTEDGTGTLTRKAVIGNFEVGNDGSIYAPKSLMDGIAGYLKESVVAKRDFGTMSEDLLSRYYNAEVVVKEGDRLLPGDVVFTIDGIPHTWESKADYGIVTGVTDTISTKLVHCEVRIDAWFEGDCKMRGFGKGLIAPMEACGITCNVKDAIIIGAAGIIKDSAAAKSKMSNERRERVVVTIEYCERDFELAIAKHNPEWDEDTHQTGCMTKVYPDLCVMSFDCGNRTVTIIDENALVADVTFMIEASPVGQAVGSSSMTLPQMGFLSSLPTGNAWLNQEALPGVVRRVDALTYLHAVSNGIPVEL